MSEPCKLTFACSVAMFSLAVTSVAAADDRVGDSRATQRVERALAGDDAIDARGIEVHTRDGVVQLSGFVNSDDERNAALLRARAVAGVQEVRNDMSVRKDDRPRDQRTGGRPVADEVIAAKVRDRLDDAELGKDGDVSVEVSQGVVQLAGFVGRPEQKARAGDLAIAVEGARDVENQIALTEVPERTPE